MGDAGEVCPSGGLISLQVVHNQQRVVIEHLLEMRNPPLGVGGVAVEASANVIVDAAGGHMFER